MNSRSIVLATVIGLAVTGCAHRPRGNWRSSGVLPKAAGEFSITATSANEADALDGVRQEGEYHCTQTKKQFTVISGPESKYQGPERSGGLGIGATAASKLFGRDKSQDYRAEMNFKCL